MISWNYKTVLRLEFSNNAGHDPKSVIMANLKLRNIVFQSPVAAVGKNWSYNQTATGFFKTAVAVFLYLNWLQLQFFEMKYGKKNRLQTGFSKKYY